MNETTAVVFVDTFEPHNTMIVWEQSDIDDYREDHSWLEMGYVCYDTEKREIMYKF